MDLVVMAAGMGSRFGGLKQIEPVDEDKNFIIDYSVYDAVRAGFDRVIFIIKEENYDIFKSTIGNRLSEVVEVVYVFQKLEDVPAGVEVPKNRVKPWGTAHAIYSVKDVVSDKFAIINADDFYGYQSYQVVAEFLKNNKEDEFANAGFYVENTLSEKGAVKRGILVQDGDKIVSLIESSVEKRGNDIWATPIDKDDWKIIPEKTFVSMNIFGFTKKLMERLDREIKEFFEKEDLEKAEIYIPMVVDNMIRDNEVELKLIKTPAKWYGITYKEDLDLLKNAIAKMKENGEYPKHLYY